MSTVKELKDWLNQFPEETIVEIIGSTGNYEPMVLEVDPTSNKEHWDYVDYADNSYVSKYAPWFEKKYLYLGCITF